MTSNGLDAIIGGLREIQLNRALRGGREHGPESKLCATRNPDDIGRTVGPTATRLGPRLYMAGQDTDGVNPTLEFFCVGGSVGNIHSVPDRRIISPMASWQDEAVAGMGPQSVTLDDTLEDSPPANIVLSKGCV